jgi:hypothetical protein
MIKELAKIDIQAEWKGLGISNDFLFPLCRNWRKRRKK